jgi:hypothetical protein
MHEAGTRIVRLTRRFQSQPPANLNFPRLNLPANYDLIPLFSSVSHHS